MTNLTLVVAALSTSYIPRTYTLLLHTSLEARHLTLLEEAHIGGTTYLHEHFHTNTRHTPFSEIMKAATGVALLASAGFANAATLGRAAASPRAAASSGQLCAEGSVDEGGNWFCQQVSQILYTNVGTPAGSYNEVVHMDPATGECHKSPKAIAGGLAPFDEPVRCPCLIYNPNRS